MTNTYKPKAMVLVAGEGARLRPYTLDRPKCLVEVEGKSLLDRQLSILKAEGVSPVVLIGGYRSEMLKGRGDALKLNPRFAETNMVWTLFCAEEELHGDILICYGDIVYSRENLRAVLNSKGDIATSIDLEWESYWRARNEDPLADAETLKLRPDGTIREIGQKPKSLSDMEGQYMGLIKLTARGVDALRKVFNEARSVGTLRGKTIEKAYMTDLLQALVDAGYPIQSVPVRAGWIEVDTVSDLQSPVTLQRLKKIEETL